MKVEKVDFGFSTVTSIVEESLVLHPLYTSISVITSIIHL